MDGLTTVIDAAFTETSFVVVDFETTTPKGFRPEPIEVAALAVSASPSGWPREVWRFEALIRPPAHAPITSFDATQTRITAAMVAGRPPAATVLADLDALLTSPPYLLVAHNAPTEAGLIFDHQDACPMLARTDFLDTVRLGRIAYPELKSHRLDALLGHLGIPFPLGRHRAMPDVEVTANLFIRIVEDGARAGMWRTLHELRAVGGFAARAGQSLQESLFDL